MMAAGEIDYRQFIDLVASSAPSTGYCNTMGTATTMNSLAEALGMQLPGSAAIPAPYRDRQEMAYRTGLRIVDMVKEDLKPSDILTKDNFINAIVVNSAIGGSTNAPIHIDAIARHIGVELELEDCADLRPQGAAAGQSAAGRRISGRGLLPCRRRAGGGQRADEAGPDPRGRADRQRQDHRRELPQHRRSRTTRSSGRFDNPLKKDAGFLVLRGNLFDSAIMKTSVISPEFRERYLNNPAHPGMFEGKAVVFDGPEDYHHRIDDPALEIDEHTLLFMRGAGPIGYPGAAEVVNMRPPDYLIKKGVTALACIGDGRQSGTSGSPSILNASPEAAAGGNLAHPADRRPGADRPQQGRGRYPDLRRGNRRRAATILAADGRLQISRAARRRGRKSSAASSASSATARCSKPAVKYQRIAQTDGLAARQPLGRLSGLPHDVGGRSIGQARRDYCTALPFALSEANQKRRTPCRTFSTTARTARPRLLSPARC